MLAHGVDDGQPAHRDSLQPSRAGGTDPARARTCRGACASRTMTASRCSPSGPGLHTAGKLFAVLNFAAASNAEVQWAISKLGDASDPDGFFTRIASLAMRTEWGLHPDAPDDGPPNRRRRPSPSGSRCGSRIVRSGDMAAREANPRCRSTVCPSVNRLALEMAANEDVERRALAGELDELREAWREAEEIAAIADEMFADDTLEEFKRQYYLRLQAEGLKAEG